MFTRHFAMGAAGGALLVPFVLVTPQFVVRSAERGGQVAASAQLPASAARALGPPKVGSEPVDGSETSSQATTAPRATMPRRAGTRRKLVLRDAEQQPAPVDLVAPADSQVLVRDPSPSAPSFDSLVDTRE